MLLAMHTLLGVIAITAFAGMTAVVKATVKFPPSSQRKLGSSVFRCVPAEFKNEKYKALLNTNPRSDLFKN
jgi:hypothetical protein